MPVLRQLLILLLAAGAVTGAWFWYAENDHSDAAQQARRTSALTIDAAPVTRGKVQAVVEAVGTTRAANSVDVVPTVSGRIAKIHFESGQHVEKGSLLVSLDSAAERAAVAEAEALLDDLEGQLSRAEQLAKRQTVAKARVDELRAQVLASRARRDAALSRLADRRIRAPFDGVVGLRTVSVGAWVDDSTSITTLDALDTLEIEFSVPEIFFSQVRPGTPLRATSPAFKGRDFVGSVTTVDSRIDPATRSFRVRGEMSNPDRILPAGMFMTAALVLDEHVGLLIPEEAVIVEGTASYVFRIRDERAERVRVGLGARVFGRVEILDGLAEGETIATSGLQRLRDGSAVTVRTPAATTPTG